MQTNVLVTAAGRRVELMQCLRSSLESVGQSGMLIAADASPDAPAGARADGFELVPRVDDSHYLARLHDIVQQWSIRLVVPTIDTELSVLATAAAAFRDVRVHALVSGLETIEISSDKVKTHAFLREVGIPQPRQWSAGEARDAVDDLPYPVVIKPVRGSSSIDVSIARHAEELRGRVREGDIVQSRSPGKEYTVDVWVDQQGEVRSVVPRRRIEVRGGEVSKGVTQRHDVVVDLARQVAAALPDAYGPLTVQIFADDNGSAEVIEINPRFGGGYPLSWEAGARTTEWALQDALGQALEPASFDWIDGLMMLRYDQSVFVREQDLPT